MYRYRDNSGTTRKSLERAKLHLSKIGTPLYIRGYIYHGRYDTNHVGVMVHGTKGTARFSGFAWGYSGEGVRGLREFLTMLNVPEDEQINVCKYTLWGAPSDKSKDIWRINLLVTGRTDDNNKFYERRVNRNQIVAQENRLGEWHGYVNQLWKQQFKTEQDAVNWVKSYGILEVA